VTGKMGMGDEKEERKLDKRGAEVKVIIFAAETTNVISLVVTR
jgi:hypothetical protein